MTHFATMPRVSNANILAYINRAISEGFTMTTTEWSAVDEVIAAVCSHRMGRNDNPYEYGFSDDPWFGALVRRVCRVAGVPAPDSHR